MSTSKLRHFGSFKTVAGAMLDELGIDDNCDISPQLGRNYSAIVRPQDADPFFIKVITGIEATERFDRSVSFSYAKGRPEVVKTPALLAANREACTVVYEVVDAATKMSTVVTDPDVEQATWRAIGAEIAALHSWKPQDSEALDSSQPALPPSGDQAFSLDFYESASAGQIELFAILQTDKMLRNAIVSLLDQPFDASPIHGDLRTDQILLENGKCWMIDWEDFRFGDPARDLGSILGEVFFHHMRPLFKMASEQGAITPESMQRAGGILIDNVRPAFAELWKGYLGATTFTQDSLDGLLDRTVGYVGWQAFDRSLSIGGFVGQISGFEKALIGMGRQMLIHRGAYASVLGLEM